MVGELRVEPDQIDLLVERGAGGAEHLVEHVRQRDQRRADVEDIAVVFVGGEFAADDVAALEHGDLMPECPEPDGCRQPPDTAADHDDSGVSHGTS